MTMEVRAWLVCEDCGQTGPEACSEGLASRLARESGWRQSKGPGFMRDHQTVESWDSHYEIVIRCPECRSLFCVVVPVAAQSKGAA